jgi:hypothetical protein
MMGSRRRRASCLPAAGDKFFCRHSAAKYCPLFRELQLEASRHGVVALVRNLLGKLSAGAAYATARKQAECDLTKPPPATTVIY